VGSPQFVAWLAVPIIAGLLAARDGRGNGFRTPAIVGLVAALLTQLVYPTFYQALAELQVPMLLVISVRNLLYLLLLVWAIRRVLLGRSSGTVS
jgi:uncharacterized membrane protein YeaQ/YmgE (transglycosylase-associated protein family)